MKIFVTGGTGFIGTSLVPLLLSKSHELLVLTRRSDGKINKNLNFVVGDLSQPSTFRDSIKSFAPDCSVHLAWQGLPDYSFENCRDNLLIGLNLFEVLRQIGCEKVIVIGTCWEYGNLSGLVNESNIGSSLNIFASFKLALKEIGESYLNDHAARFIWVRPFFVFGPNQRPSALIPTIFHAFNLKQAPPIKNPMAVNDFVYVDDVASAILALIESKSARGVYNIGSGQPRAVWEVANHISTVFSMKKIYTNSDIDLKGACWADIKNITELGWKPKFSLEQGIQQIFKNSLSKLL